MMKQRRKNLLKCAEKIECDGLVAFQPENKFYMTGYWGNGIVFLEKDGMTTIFVPEGEFQRAKKESIDCKVVESGKVDEISYKLLASTEEVYKIPTSVNNNAGGY